MASETIAKPPILIERCSFCGSTNIAHHIEVNQTADAGRIGLSYHTRFLILGTEKLFADLCDTCGSVLRLSVDTPGKKWVTK